MNREIVEAFRRVCLEVARKRLENAAANGAAHEELATHAALFADAWTAVVNAYMED